MKHKLLFVIFLLPGLIFAQSGGNEAFPFLRIAPSSYEASLGGNLVTAGRSDIDLMWANPALLDDSLHNQASVSLTNFLADISMSTFAYAYDFEKIGIVSVGFHTLNYGEFQGYDAGGTEEGVFDARDLVFQVSNVQQAGNFKLGVSLKYISGRIATIQSQAIAVDLGGLFVHPEKEFTIGMAFKNMGIILDQFSDASQSLPFDIEAGTTFKPRYMPFRFTITVDNFFDDQLYYQLPEDELSGMNEYMDYALRHLTLGTELILGKSVTVRGGYNHLLRRELKHQSGSGGAGFSFGFDLSLKRFGLNYGFQKFHFADGVHYFGLKANFNQMFFKKNS